MKNDRTFQLQRPPIFHFVWIACCLALLFFSSLSTIASTNIAEAIAQSRALIQNDIAPKVPGLAVAVAIKGSLVWSEGFGYADLAAKTPVTTTTRFRIGSISKPLTAAGLALLIEKGEIDLDAPVQKYLPDFPHVEDRITIRQLAGHLSGIRNYKEKEAISNKTYPNLRAGLKIFADDPLIDPPGTKFSYSSYNWNVIGVVMEAVTKQDYLTYMQSNVLQPFGLTNTVPDHAHVADPHRSQFYECDPAGNPVIAPPLDVSYKWPSGGFLSTAIDLVKFGSAMVAPRVLKPETHQLLFTSQTNSLGEPTHYGVGWFVGKTTLYHDGDSVGGNAVLLILPSAHVVVALAANRGHSAISEENGVPKYSKMPARLAYDRNAAALHIAKFFDLSAPAPASP